MQKVACVLWERKLHLADETHESIIHAVHLRKDRLILLNEQTGGEHMGTNPTDLFKGYTANMV